MTPLKGDKVRLKTPTYLGEYGTILRRNSKAVWVRVAESGKVVKTRENNLTNLSLAARKAWLSLPVRAVGRKKGTKLFDRVSVTLRIDRELWRLFQEMERKGIIENRSKTINTWLRQKVEELMKGALS